MSKLGGGRMPRIGSNVVDERATRMIHDWIARMPAAKAGPSRAGVAKVAPEDRDAIESLRHGRSAFAGQPARRRSAGWRRQPEGP